ncbi:hypothetical protein FALB51S_00367 [Frigidibacter albus]|uniref:Uncharacterized protein n=1 Tax=Frigidibacter mobilis TaxID=1335048 RepID=A0A159Z8S4_9RHOB|nr:hypothetical protein AKL17_3858 [Frigidibacter mobilis]
MNKRLRPRLDERQWQVMTLRHWATNLSREA